jgi:hypothetical protein
MKSVEPLAACSKTADRASAASALPRRNWVSGPPRSKVRWRGSADAPLCRHDGRAVLKMAKLATMVDVETEVV